MRRDIHFEVFYPHAPERVWRAITDPAQLSSWLMATDFEAVVGRRFTMRAKPAPGFDGLVSGEVLEADPPRRLVYSWSGGPLKDTLVIWTLEARGEGTWLRLEHRGFSGLAGLGVSVLLGMGWGRLLRRTLPEHLTGPRLLEQKG